MSEIIVHKDIFQKMEEWAPKSFAYKWDSVGLQIGSEKDETKGVVVSLDVNASVVQEAIDQGANLIIAHHPILFRPLKTIDTTTVLGNLVEKIIKHNITIYASHTNLDIAEGGVNDLLGKKIGLQNLKPLIKTNEEILLKLIVFTPENYVQQVVDHLSKAGAGHIGNYSHCTFQSAGTGTFMPREGTDPFIGVQNKLEQVSEVKIETIVPKNQLPKVLKAMNKAHPYEEVAYDLIPLANKGVTHGLGRIGSLTEQVNLRRLVDQIKNAYKIDSVRVVGDLEKNIKKVAIIGGSGEKYIEEAYKQGADLFITGDLTFHQAQYAQDLGLAIIDPGHYAEKIMKQAVRKYLATNFPTIPMVKSIINTDPFKYF